MRDCALGKAPIVSAKSGVLFLNWIATFARRKEPIAPDLLTVLLAHNLFKWLTKKMIHLTLEVRRFANLLYDV